MNSLIKKQATARMWMIAYRKYFKNNEGNNNGKWQLLSNTKLINYADPFLYSHNGHTYVFYEYQNSWSRKGKIACLCIDRLAEPPKIVLKEPWHLSYPFVFQYNSDIYMIPETRNAFSIRLYKAVDFPYKWKYEHELISDINAVDTNLLFIGNDIWLFTYSDCKLLIYKLNKSLTEGRLIHIIPDKDRTLRPAGTILKINNEKYVRPAQNCSEYYGKSVIFYRIDELNEELYKETVISYLTYEGLNIPGYSLIGVHTYNKDSNYEIIDLRFFKTSIRILVSKYISFILIKYRYYWKIISGRKRIRQG